MTNYNERLDKILAAKFATKPDGSAWCTLHLHKLEAGVCRSCEAKQALTSLTKELVAEAKPHKRLPDDSPTADEDLVNYGYNQAIDQFEQNLLKALEEVE